MRLYGVPARHWVIQVDICHLIYFAQQSDMKCVIIFLFQRMKLELGAVLGLNKLFSTEVCLPNFKV